MWPYLCPCEITASTWHVTAPWNGSPGLSCVHFALQRIERALSSPCKSRALFSLSVLAALGAQPKPGICKWEAQMDFSGQPSAEDLAVFRSCPSTWFTPVRSGMREAQACGCVLLPPLGDNTAFSWEASPAERWHQTDHICGNLSDYPAHLQQECFERMF